MRGLPEPGLQAQQNFADVFSKVEAAPDIGGLIDRSSSKLP
jgi:hypothetical protein